MITFDSVSQEEMEAMCTPMHRILSSIPVTQTPTPVAPKDTWKTAEDARADQAPDPKSANGHEHKHDPASSTGALYLGSMTAMHDRELLEAHHIAHLVQVLEVPWLPQDDATAGFACYRIDISDSSSAALRPHLGAACDYIRDALGRGENVLVHCQQVRPPPRCDQGNVDSSKHGFGR